MTTTNPSVNSSGNSVNPGRAVKRVQYGESVIEYRVQRSRRRKKTIQISVNDDGVVVAAPARTPDRELQDVVLRRAAWIIQRLAERKPAPEPPRWVSGERLLYRGAQREIGSGGGRKYGFGEAGGTAGRQPAARRRPRPATPGRRVKNGYGRQSPPGIWPALMSRCGTR